MKLGSLFDRSGGFPLAASMCGITPVFASEIEPYPIAVTTNRFPHMRHYGDVSQIKGSQIEPVDILTFGSPCQDLSVAGKRAGLKHESNGDDETTRSGLFMEAVRIIKEMRRATNGEYPRFAVWENVPGAFSSNKGEDFRIVLEELIRICEPEAPEVPSPGKAGWPYSDTYVGDGWSLAYRTFDAQYWGVPQRRRRIYLVLDLTGERAPEILFKREGLRGYFETGRTPWKRTAGNAEDCAGADDCKGESGCVAAGFCTEQSAKARGIGYQEEVCPTLRAGVTPAVMCKCYDARGNGDGNIVSTLTGDHENRITDYTSLVCEPVPIHDQATRYAGKRGDNQDGKGNGFGVGNPGDPAPTITSCDRHAVCYCMAHGQANAEIRDNKSPCLNCNHEQPIVFCTDCRTPDKAYLASENDNAGTLTAGDGATKFSGDQSVFNGNHHVIEEYKISIVRRLTPTECARLQGFPDRWGDIPHKQTLTDEEYSFWLEVRNIHAAINGKATKDYTKKQMLTWYNKLHTDSAEYKMWGNGIALPNALYVMQGIAEVTERERN